MKYVEPPHPRQEPRFVGELTGEHIRFLFRDCVDFGEREVLIGGDPEEGVFHSGPSAGRTAERLCIEAAGDEPGAAGGVPKVGGAADGGRNGILPGSEAMPELGPGCFCDGRRLGGL